MKFKSLAMLAALVMLVGCTLPKSSNLNPTPGSSGISGNWEITLDSTLTGRSYPFGIYLTQTGSTVSGIGSWVGEAFPLCMGANGVQCDYPYSMLSPNFTGTVGTDGSIILTSATSGSYPITIAIHSSTTDNTTLSGSFAVTLGSTADQGPVTGTMIAPLNGTYMGTLVSSVTGNSVGVTTTLNQSGPVSGSYLEYSGSASFTGVSCIGSVTVPASGNFFGDQLNMELLPANIPHSGIYLTGTISPDAKTIAVNYVSLSSSCSPDFATGTLTLQ